MKSKWRPNLCVFVGVVSIFGRSQASAECAAIPGGVNGDETANVADTQCVITTSLWVLAGSVPPAPGCLATGPSDADLDCSSEVNITDIQLAIQYALGTPLATVIDGDQDGCHKQCETTCEVASDCDDGVDCTVDDCLQPLGCVSIPSDANCASLQVQECENATCIAGYGCAVLPRDGACAPIAELLCLQGRCEPHGCDSSPEPIECATHEGCNNFLDCDDNVGCLYTPPEDCDGDLCTSPDVCDEYGTCTPGRGTACEDESLCTDEICDPVFGCRFVPNQMECEPASACTVGGRCTGSGDCWGASPPDCEDVNACTLDSCQTEGCVNIRPPVHQAPSVGVPSRCYCCEYADETSPYYDGCLDSGCVACVENNLPFFLLPGACANDFDGYCRYLARIHCHISCGCQTPSCCAASGGWGCSNTTCEDCVASKTLRLTETTVFPGWMCVDPFFDWSDGCARLAAEQCGAECGCCPVAFEDCDDEHPLQLSVGATEILALTPSLPADRTVFVSTADSDVQLVGSSSSSIDIKAILASKDIDMSFVVARYALPSAPQTICEARCPVTVVDVARVDFEPHQDGGELVVTAPPERQVRLFPDTRIEEASALGTGSPPPARNFVQVVAQVEPAIEGVVVYFRSYDVDDPTSSSWPVDCEDSASAPGAPNDNRGRVAGSTSEAFPGDFVESPYVAAYSQDMLRDSTVPDCLGGFAGRLCTENGQSCAAEAAVVSASTDGMGRARVRLATSYAPGDNFRVVASLDDSVLDSWPAEDVPPGETGGKLEDTRITASPTITIWRHLYIDIDKMVEPTLDPPTLHGPFAGAGVNDTNDIGDDDHYPFPVAEEYLSHTAWIFQSVFMKVSELGDVPGATVMDIDLPFEHHMSAESVELLLALNTYAMGSRQMKSYPQFYSAQLVLLYEGDFSKDHDPNSESYAGGIAAGVDVDFGGLHDWPSVINTEVARDVHARRFAVGLTDIVALDVYVRRMAAHEIFHRFGVGYDSEQPVTDEGPILVEGMLNGTSTQLAPQQWQIARARAWAHPGVEE